MKGRCEKCGYSLIRHYRGSHRYCPRCGGEISAAKREEIRDTGIVRCLLGVIIAVILLIIASMLY